MHWTVHFVILALVFHTLSGLKYTSRLGFKVQPVIFSISLKRHGPVTLSLIYLYSYFIWTKVQPVKVQPITTKGHGARWKCC